MDDLLWAPRSHQQESVGYKRGGGDSTKHLALHQGMHRVSKETKRSANPPGRQRALNVGWPISAAQCTVFTISKMPGASLAWKWASD